MIDGKKIGVSLVNYHSYSDTRIAAKLYNSFQCVDNIVIVNNDTKNYEEFDDLETCSDKIKVIYKDENLGYSRGNNVALKYLIDIGCEYFIVSNTDIAVDEVTIVKTIKCIMCMSKTGAAAPRMKNSNDQVVPIRILKLGYIRVLIRVFMSETFFDGLLEKCSHNKGCYVTQSFLPGSLFCCSSKAMADCGFFDENVFLYREEEILGNRLNDAGYVEMVLMDEYFNHNHPYSLENTATKINRQKIVFNSELYYFKKYLHANNFQLQYVKLMQDLYFFSRYTMWKLNDIRRNKNVCEKYKAI